MKAPVFEWVSTVIVRALSRSGAILCYHGVTTSQYPAANTMHAGLDELVATFGALHGVCRIVPLSELLQRHQGGRATKGLLAITFDDAYATLLSVGDILDRLGIPATIFPVGDATANGAAFWWDRVDDVFPRVAPARWRQFEDACGVPDAFRRGQPEEFGPLRPFRQWMLSEYHGRWPARLAPQLTALEHEAGYATVQRSMTWSEIERLTRQGEIDVGVHTMSHPVLPFLTDAEVEREITACFAAVSERSARAVPLLAVPYGLGDARVVRLARAAGMRAALSLAGTLRRARTLDWVPRICMSAHIAPWRLKLQLAGIRDGPWGEPGDGPFPTLPSATT